MKALRKILFEGRLYVSLFIYFIQYFFYSWTFVLSLHIVNWILCFMKRIIIELVVNVLLADSFNKILYMSKALHVPIIAWALFTGSTHLVISCTKCGNEAPVSEKQEMQTPIHTHIRKRRINYIKREQTCKYKISIQTC